MFRECPDAFGYDEPGAYAWHMPRAFVVSAIGALILSPVAMGDSYPTLTLTADSSGRVSASGTTTKFGVPWHLEVANTSATPGENGHFDPAQVKFQADGSTSATSTSFAWTSPAPLLPGTYFGRVWEDVTAVWLQQQAVICKLLGCVPTWDGKPILGWSALANVVVPKQPVATPTATPPATTRPPTQPYAGLTAAAARAQAVRLLHRLDSKTSLLIANAGKGFDPVSGRSAWQVAFRARGGVGSRDAGCSAYAWRGGGRLLGKCRGWRH